MLAVETLLAKYASAPFVVLSDFDGTISTEDSNDAVIDKFGMGPVARRKLWSKVVTGEDGANFRDCFKESLESVRPNMTFDEVVAFLRKGQSSRRFSLRASRWPPSCIASPWRNALSICCQRCISHT